jgi:hypothetical protein
MFIKVLNKHTDKSELSTENRRAVKLNESAEDASTPYSEDRAS